MKSLSAVLAGETQGNLQESRSSVVSVLLLVVSFRLPSAMFMVTDSMAPSGVERTAGLVSGLRGGGVCHGPCTGQLRIQLQHLFRLPLAWR
ncbi:MAG: hypothetical protein CM15mV74_270 [uncultured marine virus]|nr:MAG: hypothetical protein CM15mV74_270 [uncultured marine virus]